MRPEKIKPSDVYKMRSTLKSLMREWSIEGASERQSAYTPIIEEVDSYFAEQGRKPFDPQSGERISVLNPGCGLGRLVFEFAVKGYRSQGNEFAYFMLLPSNFILNQTESAEQFEIYPFIHCFSNLRKVENAFQKIMVPDVCPNQVFVHDHSQFDFSMTAGEFIDVY